MGSERVDVRKSGSKSVNQLVTWATSVLGSATKPTAALLELNALLVLTDLTYTTCLLID